MLLKSIGRNKHWIGRHKYIVRHIILALAPLTLLSLRGDYSLRSCESMHGDVDPAFNLRLEEPADFEPKPPGQTICIVMERWDAALAKEVRHLRLRTRSVLLTDRDTEETYFAKLKIRPAENSCVCVHPLQNFQPNSDILVLAIRTFGARPSIQLRDILFSTFDNSVEIHLDGRAESRERLLILLRYYMNIEAFTWCNFYYAPLKDCYVRAEPLGYFMIAMILVMSYDAIFNVPPFLTFLGAAMFILCPALALFFYDRRLNALRLILYGVLNFKFGFLFSLLFYVHTVAMILADGVSTGASMAVPYLAELLSCRRHRA